MYLCATLAGAGCDRTANVSLSRVCLAAYYALERLLFGMSANVAQKVLCPSKLSVAVRTLPFDWHIGGYEERLLFGGSMPTDCTGQNQSYVCSNWFESKASRTLRRLWFGSGDKSTVKLDIIEIDRRELADVFGDIRSGHSTADVVCLCRCLNGRLEFV